MISQNELQKMSFFREMSPEATARMGGYFSLRRFPPEEYIFLRGEPADSMFFIIEGKVVVTLTNAEGSDYTIANLREGGFFGELGLLAGEPRSAHVKAVTPVLVAEIDQVRYRALTEAFPEVDTRLTQLLSRRASRAKALWQGDRVKSAKGISRSLLPNPEPMSENYYPGVSTWARDMNRVIEEIASTDTNILIVGEPGTERVFIARLIVSKDRWKDLPFIA
jgi:signal-transduction protein with cAMP-binding, CBS, and nucleotidyltransferase domain